MEEPEVDEFDYEYRVDTDVITSVEVSGGQSDPDNPVTVQFIIEGNTYTVSNVYYPEGDSQLVWVKWHTPDEPCVCTIRVRVQGGGTAQSTITANIVDLDGNDPPNPVADDRNDDFTLVSIQEKEEVKIGFGSKTGRNAGIQIGGQTARVSPTQTAGTTGWTMAGGRIRAGGSLIIMATPPACLLP